VANDKMREEIFDHSIVVSRYDEILSVKASQHSVKDMEFKIDKKFESIFKDYDDRIQWV
jgi:hypothetical protein